MNKRMSGQITLETAIIMPIVLIVISTFLSISLYIHDLVTIKSYVYSVAIECKKNNIDELKSKINSSINKIPVFLMRLSAECKEKSGSYHINIYLTNKNHIVIIDTLFLGENVIEVEIEKDIDTEIMYALRAVVDNLD